MPSRTVLLDTSFIVALENKDDVHHERAKEIDRQLLVENSVLLLHWAILFEIADGYARIGRRARGMHLLRMITTEKDYLIWPMDGSLFENALSLYLSRHDKEWSLTDCASFVLMNLKNVTEALTADIHFRQAGFNALLLSPS